MAVVGLGGALAATHGVGLGGVEGVGHGEFSLGLEDHLKPTA
jgi:hypothetical protein